MRRLAIVFAVLPSCAVGDAQGQTYPVLRNSALTICDVMSNPGLHVGRRITIQGVYLRAPHERLLYDGNCPSWTFIVIHSLERASSAAAERLVSRSIKKSPATGVLVIYSGTLAYKAVVAGCAAPTCLSYSLQDAQLLAASPRQ